MLGLALLLMAASPDADASAMLAPTGPLSNAAELRIGGGGGLTVVRTNTLVSPALQLSARIAPTEYLQVALPLLVTVSAQALDGVRGAATVGITGVGYDSILGLNITPNSELSLHFLRDGGAVFVSAGMRTSAIGVRAQDYSPTGFLRSGWSLRFGSRFAVGAASEMSVMLADVSGDGRSQVKIILGSPFNGPNSTVPTLRFELLPSIHLEGWLWLEVANVRTPASSFIGLSTAAAEISVSWTPRF